MTGVRECQPEAAAPRQHTPTPWAVDEVYLETVTDASGYELLECNHSDDEQCYADAAFIVEAVNSHDPLKAALAECIGQMGWTNYTDDELRYEAKMGNGKANIILRARAALAGTVAMSLDKSGGAT